ncbi:MAG: hypothetical protein KBA75_10770, partial [Alphaproteobacteria bacterium]|nr:hypothetical protein [Alphaproteobacteria bacterium]
MPLRALLCLLVSLIFASAAQAENTGKTVTIAPTTANKVSGPVTGALPDKIDLSINPFHTVIALSGRRVLTVPFCTVSTSYTNVTVNGRTQREAHTNCITPGRKLNQRGRRVLSGITMQPELAGTWRWQSDYSLAFTPKQNWPNGQAYQVTFAPEVFPEQVKLSNANLAFSTAPLTVNIFEMNFFQDPTDVAQKGVTAKLRTSAAVELEEIRRALTVTLEELTDDAKPTEKKIIAVAANLPFEIKLDEAETVATVTVPLQTLPDKERSLRLNVAPGIIGKFGGQPLADNNQSRLQERVQIASRFSYAKIGSME